MNTAKNVLEDMRRRDILNWIVVILGTCMYVLGIKLFLQPANLYSGGITGISQILNTLFFENKNISLGGLDAVGILYFAINLPLLVLAYRSMGRRFVSKTVVCVILSSILMSMIPRLKEPLVDDVLTSCLIAGIIVGVGGGMVLKSGGSSGGLDVIGVFFTKKYKNFSIGRIAIYINFLIFASCLLLFDVQTTIYSIIFVTFYSFVVDKVHTQVINVEVIIITKSDGKQISNFIMKEFERGVTYWDGTGAFTGEPVKILYAALSKYEAGVLRRQIMEYDPNSFVVLKEGNSIDGRFPKHM